MRLVFDAQEWFKTGDIGDNSQFWKPATILVTDSDGTCIVQFEDGRISKGHFYKATRPIPNTMDRAVRCKGLAEKIADYLEKKGDIGQLLPREIVMQTVLLLTSDIGAAQEFLQCLDIDVDLYTV